MNPHNLAYEKIQKSKTLLDEARNLLYEAAYKCAGDFDEAHDGYHDQVKSAFMDLAHVRDRLGA